MIDETTAHEKQNTIGVPVEPIVRRRTPEVLLAASRQYQHNDCSGFVAGFDYAETVNVVLMQENRQDAADQLINSLYESGCLDAEREAMVANYLSA